MESQHYFIIAVFWILFVSYFVLSKEKKIFISKFITRKKTKENSPIRRNEGQTEASAIINKSLDSGEIALLIQVDKNLEIDPKLIHDLEEDIQTVIYRKQRGEEVFTSEKEEGNNNINTYINILK